MLNSFSPFQIFIRSVRVSLAQLGDLDSAVMNLSQGKVFHNKIPKQPLTDPAIFSVI